VGVIIKFLPFIGLLYLNNKSPKPLVYAGLYCGVYFLFGLMTGYTIQNLILPVLIIYVLLTVYYYLLTVFSDSILYWIILVGGIAIILI
jgi:hypothetical protein